MELTQNSVEALRKVESLIESGTYKGKLISDIYDLVNDKETFEPTKDGELFSDANHSFQECYLGYIPSKDLFLTGFDCWVSMPCDCPDWCDDEPCQDGECPNTDNSSESAILWKLDEDGELKIVDRRCIGCGMWYSGLGGYNRLKDMYKDIVDIRLD
ncbi:hypothetical protein [Vibrio crassostreae]|uniref:hypothetical protein n=1 Tax=Vibrio crassostreae TaxID=246167 RepID=UPI001B30D642|nr:hypothetical protein [Vibrio crassostreae]